MYSGSPKATIFIFPHAGGSNYTYHSLEKELLPFFSPITFCYPGRSIRFTDPMPNAVQDLATDLAHTILQEYPPSNDFYFLGHSFGSLVLFETLRILRDWGSPLPNAVFISGRHAPSIPMQGKLWHQESDTSLFNFLQAKGGIPKELSETQEFFEIFLPIIRSDLKLLEIYEYKQSAPFDIPFYILNGSEDSGIDDAKLKEWQQETKMPCVFNKFPGSHFYLLENIKLFATTLNDLYKNTNQLSA